LTRTPAAQPYTVSHVTEPVRFAYSPCFCYGGFGFSSTTRQGITAWPYVKQVTIEISVDIVLKLRNNISWQLASCDVCDWPPVACAVNQPTSSRVLAASPIFPPTMRPPGNEKPELAGMLLRRNRRRIEPSFNSFSIGKGRGRRCCHGHATWVMLGTFAAIRLGISLAICSVLCALCSSKLPKKKTELTDEDVGLPHKKLTGVSAATSRCCITATGSHATSAYQRRSSNILYKQAELTRGNRYVSHSHQYGDEHSRSPAGNQPQQTCLAVESQLERNPKSQSQQ